nr:radical SAM protein [Bacteriovorax sp. HI3]
MALTQDCNYRCTYCYAFFQRNEGHRMTKDVVFRFLADCADLGVKAITFTGDGESTLSPVFSDAVLEGKRLGLDMAAASHGEKFGPLDLEKILPALTYLRINISAATPERYAKIHGTSQQAFFRVKKNIEELVRIKRENNLSTTIGLQMVLMPENGEDIIPLADFAVEMGVDYLVIKHCSDDKDRTLGIDYSKYFELKDVLEAAQRRSNSVTQITAKMSKIMSQGKREYTKCFGPTLMLQISGTGLVAPCGDLFATDKKRFHIGNICEQSFKEIWHGEKFREVMEYIGSDEFNPQTQCGTLCLQHLVNTYLYDLKENNGPLLESSAQPPQHINFI